MGKSWSDNNWAVAGVLGVTLMTAIGFLIGPMADYSAMVNTQQPNQQEEVQTELPQTNFQEEPFDLGPRQQLQLTFPNDVVFVNAFYTSEDEREQMSFMQNFPEEYNQRVYTSLTDNTADSTMVTQYGLTEQDLPIVIIVGGSGESAQDAVRQLQGDQITQENVNAAICDVFQDWNDLAAKCI